MASSTSSGFVKNLQAGKTVVECNLRMLQEEDSCDVTFRCGPKGHVVKAHRYMLISRSCVFHAMLTGPMAEKSDVKIPDIETPVFKIFLKYIYTDNTDINADNVTALLYTARKYGVTTLEIKCSEFLDRNLSPDNACVILEAAHRFDQKQLYEKALTLVKSQGDSSLQSPGFLALSQVLVDEIVGSDDLEADEHVIFTAVNDWSEAECEREGREVTPESKRSVLGVILMKVRFPLMKPTFFAKTVRNSKLLTDTERIMCFDFALAPEEATTNFNNKPRTRKILPKTVSNKRFLCKYDFTYLLNDRTIYESCFSSNSNLIILGCQFKFYEKDTSKFTYYVTSYMSDKNVLSHVVQERTEYHSGVNVIEVIFSRPVSISAGKWYTLAVEIKFPDFQFFREEKVVCDDGLELQFRDFGHDGTIAKKGQITSLIYRKC